VPEYLCSLCHTSSSTFFAVQRIMRRHRRRRTAWRVSASVSKPPTCRVSG
jgi:hypothetical protein